MDEPTLARFMAKVNKTETCWLWTACLNYDGYGRFGIKKSDGRNVMVLAYHLSYQHHHGEIQEGLVVRHKCLNKHCVNPDHLEVGTRSQNQLDRRRDGTDARGEKHWGSKLTNDKVIQIRILAEIGVDRRLKTLANMFGISENQAWGIINRRNWKHLN